MRARAKAINMGDLVERTHASICEGLQDMEGAKVSKTTVERVLRQFRAEIHSALNWGEEITIRDFLRLRVVKRPARAMVNPKTRAKIHVAAKRVALCKYMGKLADEVPS